MRMCERLSVGMSASVSVGMSVRMSASVSVGMSVRMSASVLRPSPRPLSRREEYLVLSLRFELIAQHSHTRQPCTATYTGLLSPCTQLMLLVDVSDH